MPKITKSYNNRALATAWWGNDARGTALNKIDVEAEVMTRKTKTITMKHGGGKMILFKVPILFKVSDATTLCAVDENKKVCIQLGEEEYDMLNNISEVATTHLIEPKKSQLGYNETVTKGCVYRSAASGKAYCKVKIQTLGTSRTTGISQKDEEVLDTLSLLQSAGVEGDFLLKVEGVYISSQYCGLLTKVDMFKVKKAPSDAELEDLKAKRVEEAIARRDEQVSAFVGGDVKRVKTA
jgi:hypothetical protein